jgi:hypothetical protein
MWEHENVFGLLVQWVCCCAGREGNNQPSMKAAKVMDGRDKKDRTAAGKGWQKGTAAGDESVDIRWVPVAAAKSATMRTIDAGWVTRQPPLCHDACVFPDPGDVLLVAAANLSIIFFVLPSADDTTQEGASIRLPLRGGGIGSIDAAAALAAASAGRFGRVRLTMLTPVVAQTITSSFRCWVCLPHNYISNGNNESDGHKESDDGTASDDCSGGRVGGQRSGPPNDNGSRTTRVAGWAVHGFVRPPPCLATKTVSAPPWRASRLTTAAGIGTVDRSGRRKEERRMRR